MKMLAWQGTHSGGRPGGPGVTDVAEKVWETSASRWHPYFQGRNFLHTSRAGGSHRTFWEHREVQPTAAGPGYPAGAGQALLLGSGTSSGPAWKLEPMRTRGHLRTLELGLDDHRIPQKKITQETVPRAL